MYSNKELLEQLDNAANKGRRAKEDILVDRGEAAVGDILSSVTEVINELLKGHATTSNINLLENRVIVLGRIRSQRGIKAILGALADSADKVEVVKRQMAGLHNWHNNPTNLGRHDMLFSLDMEKTAAKSLRKASTKALISIGSPVLPYIDQYLSAESSTARRAMLKVASKIKKKWWQFWK